MESSDSKERPLVSLVRASEADIETLLEQERSVAGPYTYSAMLEEEDWKEAFATELVYLLKCGNDTVGNLSYEEKGPEHIYISGLVVRPEFQGRGIARSALEQLLSKYPNAKRVDLVTHPDNPALKLYESLGFNIESRKENYWGDGEPRLTLALTRS